jgi:signal transduction histidine kinase/CheY-like chemotaxis protein
MSTFRLPAFPRRVFRVRLATIRLAVAAMATVGLVLTASATVWVWRAQRAERVTAFAYQADDLAVDFQNDINRSLQLLDDLAIADQSVAGLGQSEFETYVNQVVPLHPELLGLGWVPRVTDSDRAAFEREAQTAIGDGFKITEQDAAGNFVPATTRPEYFPIYYSGPTSASASQGSWLGFDLASSLLRQQALRAADDTNQSVATAPITLFQDDRKTGFLVMRAVRSINSAISSTEPGPLRGYVQATLSIDKLLRPTLGVHDTTALHLELNDVPAAGGASSPLYSSAAMAVGPVLHVSEMSVAGRRWELAVSPTQAAAIQPPLASWLPLLMAGILVTLLAVTLLTLGMTRRNLELARVRAREELVAMVSHDLRTPASSLIAGAEILFSQDLPEAERQDVLATMVSEGQRLNALLTDFLEAHDAGRGRLRVAPRPTDLRALLGQAVASVGADPKRPLRLELPDELPWVLADPDRIQQLVGNLLSNARKYSPEGGAIDLSAELRLGMVQISVSDRGLGIPMEALEHLFDPYYRVDSESRRGIRGTGLGLAIVKGIAEAHGGQIGAESAGPGHGSRFWFTLPAVERAEVSLPEPATVHVSARPSAGVQRSALRMLVVDDEPAVGNMVRRLVRTNGHEVTVATSADTALERLELEAFDVVLSDLGLGTGLDGWQLADVVRTRWPGTRFLLATGSVGINLAEARRRGVTGVLTKPYSPEELRRALAGFASDDTSSLAA